MFFSRKCLKKHKNVKLIFQTSEQNQTSLTLNLLDLGKTKAQLLQSSNTIRKSVKANVSANLSSAYVMNPSEKFGKMPVFL